MKIKNEIERQREVDEMRMTKWRTDSIYFPRDLNTHDPDNQYVWADELDSKKLLWNSITIGGAALFFLGLCAGMYCIGFLLGVML